MADVVAKDVHWFWKPYIALGKVTCLEGDPGIGKSWLLAALASYASRGLLPDNTSLPLGPCISIIANAEDDIADTVKKRLDAMFADCSYIHMFEKCPVYDEAGAARIKAAVTQHQPRLVTVDPLTAYVGAKMSMNQANHMRAVITQLKDIAEQYRCAVIIARHLNKGSSENAKYRGNGSIDITGACRSVLLASQTAEGECTVKQTKCNNAREGRAFTYQTTEEGEFVWCGYNDTTAEEMLTEKSVSQNAEAFLEFSLASGSQLSQELIREASKLIPPVSVRSLQRAAQKLGIVTRKLGMRTTWELPEAK